MTTEKFSKKEAINRLLREHRDAADDAFESLGRKFKRNRGLSFYKTLYAPVARAFVKTYVGGTNKNSFAVLLTLMEGRGLRKKRSIWGGGEKFVFPRCYYADHQNLRSFLIPVTYVIIAQECIQQIYQCLSPRRGASEKGIHVERVLEQFAGAVIYADMWAVLLVDCLERLKGGKLDRLSFPVPAKDGLLLCRMNDGEQFVFDAFVSDESLSAEQKGEKENLKRIMSPFLDSMIQFKSIANAPGDNNPNKDVHFKPLPFLMTTFARVVHQRFRPEDYPNLYGCDGGGDGGLTARTIAEGMRMEDRFAHAKGTPEMKRVEDLSAAYLAMGEREFLKKMGSSLPFCG